MMDDVRPETRAVADRIDIDHLEDRLSGRGGGLRVSKPTAEGDSGLEQYVWRMARFHSGADASMPVMARAWLDTWLDEEGIDADVFGRGRSECDAGDEIVDLLDDVVTVILVRMGKDPAGGAKRWAPLLGLGDA